MPESLGDSEMITEVQKNEAKRLYKKKGYREMMKYISKTGLITKEKLILAKIGKKEMEC